MTRDGSGTAVRAPGAPRESRVPPQALLLVGIGSVQFGSAFADTVFDRAGPGGVAFLRVLFGAVLLLAVARPGLRGRSRAELRDVIAYGLVLAGMNWVFYEALARLPLGVAVTIEFTGPLAVAVAGSRRLVDGVWALCAGAGVVLLALRGGAGGIHALGVLFALVAAAAWATYILLSKRLGRSFRALDALAVGLGFGTFLVLPAGVVEGGTALFDPVVLGIALLVAVLSTIVPYSLEMVALRTLPTAVFGLLMSLEPAVAALAGVLILGQSVTLVLGVALVLVAGANIGATVTGRAPAPDPDALPPPA